MALAAEGGYDAVQMRAVSQRADVALGTIYRYFTSKDQLLLAGLALLAEDLHEQVRVHPPAGSTAHERVAEVLRRACAVLEEQPLLTNALVTALSSPDPAAADATREVEGRMTAIITEAVAGERSDDITDVVRVISQVWFATLLAWVGGRSAAGTMAADLERASRLLLEGGAATAAASES